MLNTNMTQMFWKMTWVMICATMAVLAVLGFFFAKPSVIHEVLSSVLTGAVTLSGIMLGLTILAGLSDNIVNIWLIIWSYIRPTRPKP